MKRWKTWTGCGVLAGALVAAVVSAQVVPAQLDGVFVFSGGSAQETAIASAISAAADSVVDGGRNDWRGQLEEMTRPAPRLSLQRIGAEFAVVDGAGVTLRSPTDSTRVALKGDWQMEQRVTGGVLEQRILNDRIDQLYRYSISRNGQQLTVDVSIMTPELGRAIAYRLTYTRQP